MSRPTITEAIRAAAARLTAAGIDGARLDAEVLAAHALGCDRLTLGERGHEPLAASAAAALDALVARRTAREPVAYLVGKREFWSLDFAVSPAVLIPRPDSETLVAAVVERARPETRAWRILDLGTGSGCLLGALLSELVNAQGVGIDIAPEAARLAARNMAALGLDRRADIRVGDWLAPLGYRERFDIVIANPPYIASAAIAGLAPDVVRHEPLMALDGGADGLDFYRRLAAEAPSHLSPGALIAVEVGAAQGPAVAALLAARFKDVSVLPDLAGRDRVVVARPGS
ncbi:MAG: peptide chain release factor N(5)-glutamine methyltransferase [Pseudomonadota bacterium]